MRRSASEIIHNLEMRIARLEKESADFPTRYQSFYLSNRLIKTLEKKVNESLEREGALYDFKKRKDVVDEKHDVIWAGVEVEAELWKSWKDKKAEVVFFSNVIFADYKGNRIKKFVSWVLEIDPSYLEYDPDFDDDGKTPILENSIFRAILASKSKLEYNL